MHTSAIEKLGLEKLKTIRKRYYELDEYVSRTPLEKLGIDFEFEAGEGEDIDRYFWDGCGATFNVATSLCSDNNDGKTVTMLSGSIVIGIEGGLADDVDISDLEEIIKRLELSHK